MKMETYLAIRALMSADGTMHPRDRAAILAAVRNHGQQPNQPAPPNLPKVLSTKEVAAMLGCSSRTVANLSTQGLLPRIRIRGRERAHGVLLSDVIELIEQSRVSASGKGYEKQEETQLDYNPVPDEELVVLAQKVAYGAASPVEKAKFKRLAEGL